MQIVIDIDENVYTRLFDNGTDFYDTDDILAMAKTIRKGTPIPDNATVCDIEQIRADIENQLFVGRIVNSKDFDDGLKWCLEIIDKYTKGESE